MNYFILITLIQTVLNDCKKGCLKCDLQANECLYCDISKNYLVEDGSCVLLQYANCLTYDLSGACTLCETGYYVQSKVCSQVSSSNLIENCLYYSSSYQCGTCIDDYYYIEGKCQQVPSLIEGCAKYKSSSSISCSVCQSGYMMSRDQQTCILIQEIDNCASYSYIKCEQCDDGYVYNQNYYLDNVKNAQENSTESAAVFRYFASPLQTPIQYCQATNIQNCVTYTSGSVCSVCEDGYFVDSGNCTINPDPAIQNCSVYQSLEVCTACNQGYYLASSISCLAVSTKANCELYSTTSSTSYCTQCASGYKVSSGTCTPRTSTINDCDTYVADSELCATCSTGFTTTTDQAACLTSITNCKVYDSSTSSSSKLSCQTCTDGLSYISADQLCETGKVTNCKTYSAEQKCSVCNDGYYLSSNTCIENATISNCLKYDQSSKGVCAECNANYLLFTLFNTCEQTLDIDFCEEYGDQDECSICENGYQLIDQASGNFANYCEAIDSEYNCYTLENDLCVYCKNNYVLEDGECTKVIDYLQEYCKSDNNDGTIAYNNYSCKYCRKNTIPAYMVDAYVCTAIDNLDDDTKEENCIKYEYNTDNQIYQCIKCAEGYYQQEFLCVTSCSSGYIAYVQDISKVRQTGSSSSTYYNKYSISSNNYCSIPSTTYSGCTKLAVNSFIQNVSYNVIDYVCVECQSTMIPVITVSQTSNLPVNDLSSTYTDYLLTSPGLTCVDPLSKTVYASSVTSQGFVSNCQFYADIKLEEGESIYGCVKCAFGYYGIVAVDSSRTANGYIQTCKSINNSSKPLHGLNKNCNTSTRYYGYTTYQQEIETNLIPLESFLSCYSCVSSSSYVLKPFLFLSFEDFDLVPTGTGYKNILTPDSPLTYPPQLDSYKVIYQGTDYGVIGESIRCMPQQISSLYSNASNALQTIMTTYRGDLQYCALFIVNTLRYTLAQNSKYDSEFQKDSVYCGACLPGYKSIIYSEIFADSTYQSFGEYIPYIVSRCPAIANCSSGGNWVNNCQNCRTGYGYQWDSTNRYIMYNTCISCNIQNCLACAVSSGVSTCAVCAKGYTLFPQYDDISTTTYCEKIIPPFCEDEESVFQVNFDAQREQVAMGRNYLSLRSQDTGCNQCQDGYVSLMKTDDANLKLDMVCSYSARVEQGYDSVDYLVANCSNYSIDSANDYYIKCVLCKSGYLLTEDGDCINDSSITHCALVEEDNDSYACSECESGYIFLDGECIVGTLSNCIVYDNDQTSKSQICSTCSSGYVVINGACVKGNVNYCDTYDGNTETCDSCQDGYQLLITKNDVNICLPISSSLNCDELSPEEFKDQNINCVTCSSNYYASTSTGDITSFCYEFNEISNCITYDRNPLATNSTLACTKCDTNYYLLNSLCNLRQYLDENCLVYTENNDTCTKCNTNYYLNTDQTGCVANPTGIKGCVTYKSSSVCELCDVNMYLSNNLCKEVDDLITNCEYYASAEECSICISGYYYSDSCKQTSVTNCDVPTGSNRCATCLSGYALDNSGNTSVCQLLDDANCLVFSDVTPFPCLTCSNLYYPKSGLCTLREKGGIDNCLYYSSETLCLQCNQYYTLSLDKTSCTNKSYQTQFIDQNCLDSIIVTPFFCSACKQGYYFVDGVCTACSTQTYSSGCAYCDPEDQSSCLMCRSGFYMNSSGKCVSNTASTTTDDDVDSSHVSIWSLILVISFLI